MNLEKYFWKHWKGVGDISLASVWWEPQAEAWTTLLLVHLLGKLAETEETGGDHGD